MFDSPDAIPGEVLRGNTQEWVYEVDTLYLPSRLDVSAAEEEDATSVWHSRLGHINFNSMKKLKDYVVGLPSLDCPKCHCKTCHLAKTMRARFPPSPRITKKPLELIHMDLWGPAPVPTLGGNRYFLAVWMTTLDMQRFTC